MVTLCWLGAAVSQSILLRGLKIELRTTLPLVDYMYTLAR